MSTLTDAKTYAKRVFLEAARELWLQYRAALSSFLSELSRIWDFDLSDFILTALFPPLAVAGVGLNIGGRILATIDALQELRQDISLAPQRVFASVADEAIPVPDHWGTRVMTASEALRWVVAFLLETAVSIEDLDTPAEFDLGKRIDLHEEVSRLDDNLTKAGVENFARARIKSIVIAIIVQTAIIAAAIALAFAAGWLVYQCHQKKYGDRVLKERCLSQDSRRVGGSRVNIKPGDDR